MFADMKRGLGVAAFALTAGLATTTFAADDVHPDAATFGGTEPIEVAQVAEDTIHDPLEGLNRVVFDTNEFLYSMFLRGPTEIYVGIVPPPLRSAVRNVLYNLATPVILANDILQWEWERAGETLQRFAINTTYGVGGMFDRATEMGIERHTEDFGQTLAVWGVPEPFYLVLPLLGPSNPRDAVGRLLVDGYFDPLGMYLFNTHRDEALVRTGLSGVIEYASVMNELDQIKKTSVDYYAAIRSMYHQKRNAEIRNGVEADLPPIPDLGYELAPEPTPRPAGEELGSDPSAPAKGIPISRLDSLDGSAISLY